MPPDTCVIYIYIVDFCSLNEISHRAKRSGNCKQLHQINKEIVVKPPSMWKVSKFVMTMVMFDVMFHHTVQSNVGKYTMLTTWGPR